MLLIDQIANLSQIIVRGYKDSLLGKLSHILSFASHILMLFHKLLLDFPVGDFVTEQGKSKK
jgi:hypothetical protein